MSIEQQTLDSEYELMLNLLTLRSEGPNFNIEDVELEFHHLLIYQGQGWGGRGEVKNAEIQGHVYAYQIFLKRWRDKQKVT